MSKSHLDVIGKESPAHYFDRYLASDRAEEVRTPDLILGDAIHTAVLEPDFMSARYAVWDGPSRSTIAGKEAWKEFQVTALGKTILTADQYEAAMGVQRQARRHPIVRELLKDGVAEQTYYSIDPETGELIKCRVDWDCLERHGSMVDVKSTIDASPAGFGKSVAKFRYHVQGGFYPHVVEQLGVQTKNFVFLAFEKVRPFATGVYFLEVEEQRLGMIEARRDLNLIAKCRRENKWPDYGYNPEALRLPGWKRHEIERAA